MKASRFAVLLPGVLAVLSLFKPLLPNTALLQSLLMTPSTIVGVLLLSIAWFWYFSDYRYGRTVLLVYGISSFVLSGAILVGHYIDFIPGLEKVVVPPGNTFLLNLGYMFMAIYLIQALMYWLPRTKFYVNTLLGVVLFISLLSTFGHLYTLRGIPQEPLLVPMPFGAIVSFLILILSIFNHANRMKRLYLNRKIIVSFACMLIAVIGANVVVYKNISSIVDLSNEIDTTRGTLGSLYDAGLSLNSAQADAQSYVATGDTAYTAAYTKDRDMYQKAVAKVASQASGSSRSDVHQHAQAVTRLGNQIFQLTDSNIAKKQHGALSPTTRAIADDKLDGFMTQVLNQIKSISSIYTNEVNNLVVQEAYGGRGIVLGVSVSSALSILLIVFTPLFIRQTIQDLSNTQERLRDSNKLVSEEKSRAEAILTSIGDGLFVVDKQGIITLFNHEAEKLTGRKISEALGKPYDQVMQFVQEGPQAPDLGFVERALKGGESHVDRNVALVGANAREFDVQISAAPITNQNNVVSGAIIVFRDRTSEQQLENAKDEFVSLASHQLRTPATATKQFLAMFLQGYAGKITAKQRLFLQQAYDNNELGINIIEELLNIARLENNKMIIKIERVNLNEFLEHTVAQRQAMAKKANQSITLIAPKNTIYIDADISLLAMAADNLITNALKYSFANSTVTVRLTDGEHPTLAVSDTGVGIKHEDMKKIFQRFGRLEDPNTKHITGTGMGLYLIKKIADMQHFKIKVQSEYGKGSTFTLEFKASKG